MIRRSNSAKISELGWWIVETTVRPDFASLLRKRITLRAVVESNPVVGSSRKMIDGLMSNSTPMEVLFFSPPEIPLISALPTYVSAHFDSPSTCIVSSTLSFLSSGVSFTSLILAINLKHSLGVNVANSKSSCITYPILSPWTFRS